MISNIRDINSDSNCITPTMSPNSRTLSPESSKGKQYFNNKFFTNENTMSMTMSSEDLLNTISSQSVYSKKVTPREIMKKFEDSTETKKMLE